MVTKWRIATFSSRFEAVRCAKTSRIGTVLNCALDLEVVTLAEMFTVAALLHILTDRKPSRGGGNM